jgi:hypothetical protein
MQALCGADAAALAARRNAHAAATHGPARRPAAAPAAVVAPRRSARRAHALAGGAHRRAVVRCAATASARNFIGLEYNGEPPPYDESPTIEHELMAVSLGVRRPRHSARHLSEGCAACTPLAPPAAPQGRRGRGGGLGLPLPRGTRPHPRSRGPCRVCCNASRALACALALTHACAALRTRS